MLKSRLYIIMLILGILTLISGGCADSATQTMAATPLEVPKEGSPGEYINVIIQVSSNQPCKLVLSASYKTEVDNYLSPHTSDTFTYPNSDGNVVFHERIPWETAPGRYILRVFQMTYDGDTAGREIFGQDFIVR